MSAIASRPRIRAPRQGPPRRADRARRSRRPWGSGATRSGCELETVMDIEHGPGPHRVPGGRRVEGRARPADRRHDRRRPLPGQQGGGLPPRLLRGRRTWPRPLTRLDDRRAGADRHARRGAGAEGPVAFIHPRSCHGVLVELIEAPGGPAWRAPRVHDRRARSGRRGAAILGRSTEPTDWRHDRDASSDDHAEPRGAAGRPSTAGRHRRGDLGAKSSRPVRRDPRHRRRLATAPTSRSSPRRARSRSMRWRRGHAPLGARRDRRRRPRLRIRSARAVDADSDRLAGPDPPRLDVARGLAGFEASSENISGSSPGPSGST